MITFEAMKKILTAALMVVALFAAGFSADAKKPKKVAEVTFLTTIDCKNCVKKVEAKLPYEAGIKDLKINLAEKTIWIQYDPARTDKEKLAAAIEKMGYRATEVEKPSGGN